MAYTWGQLRLLLQQFAGKNVSLDAIDEKLNSRYGLILSLMDWHGLEVAGMLETTAAYTTGTVAVTQGSNVVTGTGTLWTTAMNGLQFLTCFGLPYNVTILNNTSLTLDRPFEGVTNTALGYWLGQVVYQLPDNCKKLNFITHPVTGLEIPVMGERELAQLEGAPIVDGWAQRWSPRPDGVNPTTGNTVQQIMLWPLPCRAQGYPINYEQTAEGFDGDSTTDGPLPFVSSAALLAGCKADLEMDKETPNMAKAEGFEAAFKAHLQGMLHVEMSKQPPVKPRMAPQYTRHRIKRVVRGLGDNCFRDSW